jgi:hypothetical protein
MLNTPTESPPTHHESSPADQSLTIESLERELKFVLPAHRASIVDQWLRMTCRPDPQFAEADVWTVYYDTPDFQSFDEKANSDYLKTKIRLRWYAKPGTAGEGAVFVEAKRRVGTRREKFRVRLPVDAAAFVGRALDDGVFRDVPATLSQVGIVTGPSWEPVLALRYRRSRFTERRTGSRVNFDRQITTVRVNHRLLTPAPIGPLPLAVVEVKAHAESLPMALHALVTVGARKAAFSKYAALLDALRPSAS